MLDKLRSKLVHFGPSMMSVPVKLAPFALKRQVLEQVLSWQFRQALADGELEFLEGRWLSIHVRDIGLLWSSARPTSITLTPGINDTPIVTACRPLAW